MPVWVLRALLIAAAAPAGSLAALDSAMMSCASAYFAMGIVVPSEVYLLAVQIGVDCDVPVLPVFVTRVRGSGVPVLSTVKPRKDGSTVAQKFWFTDANTQFSCRTFVLLVARFWLKFAGILAASTAAAVRLPASCNARARPSSAKLSVCASDAVVAAVTAASNRFFASLKSWAGVISGPRLIAAEHIDSPMRTRL